MLSIYKKLLVLFKNLACQTDQQAQEVKPDVSINLASVTDNTGSLLFVLEEKNILILLNIPDTSDKTSEEIVELAENYANFIIHIANNNMYNDILDLLENRMEEDDNISNKLFVENVLHFAPILKNELEKQLLSSYINNTEPLIRPTSVFKHAIK